MSANQNAKHRRISKKEKEHFETEIKVALAGEQYKGLDKELSKEDRNIANDITGILYNRYTPEAGLSVQELTNIVFANLEISYSEKLVFKVEKIIQWLKRWVLEMILKHDDDTRHSFIICKIDNRLFNGADLKYAKKAFEYHGLQASAENVFCYMTKGGALISSVYKEGNRDYDYDYPSIPEEIEHLKGREYKKALDKLFLESVKPEDLDKEGKVISDNIRGNYTTEQGLEELGYLMHGIEEILYKLKDGESINDIELVFKLFPELTREQTKDLDVFKYYHTKVLDALYARTGDPMYLKHTVENGLFELYSKKPSPKDLEDNLKKELINNKFGDRYNTNEKMDELYDLADKLIGILDEEKETSLEDQIHRLFPETRDMYYGHAMSDDYNPELDPYFDKVKDVCYLIRVHNNTFKQNKKLQEKQMNLKQKTKRETNEGKRKVND